MSSTVFSISVGSPRQEANSRLASKKFTSYEILSIFIPSDALRKRHVLVRRRFNEFNSLHKRLSRLLPRTVYRTRIPRMPPKRQFQRKNASHIVERVVAFQRLLDTCITFRVILESADFLSFLGLSGMMRQALIEEHLRQVEGAELDETKYEDITRLQEIHQLRLKGQEFGSGGGRVGIEAHPLFITKLELLQEKRNRSQIHLFVKSCLSNVRFQFLKRENVNRIKQRNIESNQRLEELRKMVENRHAAVERSSALLTMRQTSFTRRQNDDLDREVDRRITEEKKRCELDSRRRLKEGRIEIRELISTLRLEEEKRLEELFNSEFNAILSSEKQTFQTTVDSLESQCEERDKQIRSVYDSFLAKQQQWLESKSERFAALGSSYDSKREEMFEEMRLETSEILANEAIQAEQSIESDQSNHRQQEEEIRRQMDSLAAERTQWEENREARRKAMLDELEEDVSRREAELMAEVEAFADEQRSLPDRIEELRVEVKRGVEEEIERGWEKVNLLQIEIQELKKVTE